MPTSPIQNTFGKRAPDGAWEIPILGDIGFFGVNGADLIRELQAVKPTQVRFTIFSPGGAVYDAIAVVGYMLDKGIESYTEIYGVCASAATVFAAHSGPKNTAIAPGSMFLVHMPFGGDQKAIDNAVDFLLNLYTKSYGWTKAEAKAHLEAADGEGIFWTAAEAKKLGVASEIMEGAKVAARLQLNTTAMAETKPTIKVKTKVHLSTLEAVRAAMATDGTEIELEVAQEQVATDALKAAQARNAELETELAAEKAKNTAAVEVAKSDLATANAAHTAAIAAKEAAHVLAIAELTKPLALRTVANNQEAGVGAVPGTEAENPNVVALKNALKGSTPKA